MTLSTVAPVARFLRDLLTGVIIGILAGQFLPARSIGPPASSPVIEIRGKLDVSLDGQPSPTPWPPSPVPIAPDYGPDGKPKPPQPTPPAPVTPRVSGPIWINWLSDPSTHSQQEADITTELAASPDLKTLDARFTLIRRGQPEMSRTHMDTYGDALGYPLAVIVAQTGEVLDKIRDPKSADQVLTVVKGFR